jgi:hypothetical protein
VRPLAGFCRDCGIDDQALGVAVDLGALSEQAGVGDAEIKKGGLDRTWPSKRLGTVVRCRHTPWPSTRNVGNAIGVPGDSRPRPGEDAAGRLHDLCDCTDRFRSPATGLSGLCVAGEQFFYSLLRRAGERVGDVVLFGQRSGGHQEAPGSRGGADLIILRMGQSF